MADTTEKLIQKLIKEQDISSLSEQQLKNIINKLLEYMKFEEGSTTDGYLGHEPIFNSDFPDDATSLFEKINWRADLDNGSQGKLDFDNLLNNTTALGENGIWNESIRNLINYYKANFKNDTKISGSTENSSDNYTPDDIKHANAGRNFSDGSPWVKPWENNVGQDYDTVRDTDKIEQVLRSSKNLQFTREARNTVGTILDYYIRLIMPKYTRRVEVEDLNRNFWVIGQSMSAIAAYLFDDSSPIKTVVKNSLSEILQLWENVMYLWAAVELLNEKKGEAPEPEPEPIPYIYSQTICQVVDIPRALDKPLRDINEFVNKYDNDLVAKLNQFSKMYSGKHLALLLRSRIGNYEKDYYHTEVYPYIAFYDANDKAWSYISLLNQNTDTSDCKAFPFGFTLRIDSGTAQSEARSTFYPNDLYRVQNLRDKVYAIKENSDITNPNQYRFYWPLDGMPPYDQYEGPDGNTHSSKSGDNGNYAYRAIVKIKPSIETNYSEHNDDTTIKVKISFKIEDIGRRLHWVTTLPSGWEKQEGETDTEWENRIEGYENSNDRYRDYTDENETYSKSYYVLSSNELSLENPRNNTTRKKITIDWDSDDNKYWGKKYNENTCPHGTKAGFSDNFRDSGFQGSLCDMMTYRGTSKVGTSSNQS